MSTAEIKFVKGDISDLKTSWEKKTNQGLSSVGQNLALELLAENSVLRIDLNTQQEELHKAALQRLKTLEQYTTTITREDTSPVGTLGIPFNGSPEEEDKGESDMTEKFKNLFSF